MSAYPNSEIVSVHAKKIAVNMNALRTPDFPGRADPQTTSEAYASPMPFGKQNL